jgi:hypothetical protein
MSVSLASSLAIVCGGISKTEASLMSQRFERRKAKWDAAIWSHAYRALQLTSALRHSLDFSGLVLS